MTTKEAIKAHRTAHGLTQTEYGALVGATMRAVQEWEGGRRHMPTAKWELVQIKVPNLGKTPTK